MNGARGVAKRIGRSGREALGLLPRVGLGLLVGAGAVADTGTRVELWAPAADAPPDDRRAATGLAALLEASSAVALTDAGDIDRDAADAIWVVAPAVPAERQDRVLAWTREGGRLILAPGAMTRDAKGDASERVAEALAPALEWRPLEAFEDHFGGRPARLEWLEARAPHAPAWETPGVVAAAVVAGPGRAVAAGGGDADPTGRARNSVAARFADGRPAAARFEHGEGEILVLGFFPGLAAADGTQNERKRRRLAEAVATSD